MTEPAVFVPTGTASVNKWKNQIKGKLGDREFILSATFEHIQNMESNLGRSFLRISQEFSGPNSRLFSFGEVASLIFIAQESEPKLTYNKIGDLLTKHGIKPALDMLGEFMKMALQGSEEEMGNDQAKVSP
jgi:hypothetical protein